MKQLSVFDLKKVEISKENMENPALLRDIPFDKIYEAARKEASRKKPAFFIHKYFARRITCNFRMMLLGLLLPYNENIWDYMYDSFEYQPQDDLVVFDPFMGGGTTLFESIRLNAKTVGNDLQPLSKFVSTALVKEIDITGVKKALKLLEKKVAPQIMKYYRTRCPECGEEADVMYTFHVKAVKTKCSCGKHRLFSNFVLALKKDEFTLVCPECGDVFKHNFKLGGPAECKCGYIISNPKKGFVDRGIFTCEKCGESQSVSEYTREQGYPFSTEKIAIEYYCPSCKSHDYKRIEKADEDLYEKACKKYEEIKDSLPIPDQRIPAGYNTNQIINHGYEKFSDLFNTRQLLGLGILLKGINELDDEEAKFWLQLAFSGMLEMNNMFCRYQANAYKICNIFFNHAYVPITMPVENNIWGTKLGTGNFVKTINKIIRGKRFCTEIYDISTTDKKGKIKTKKVYSGEKVIVHPVNEWNLLDSAHPLITCGDSSNLDWIPDDSIDIVLTDPPFGANVMYSELIDFFHVWNYKSSLSNKLGFTQPLSLKEEEIIVNTVQGKTQGDYQNGLAKVFSECNKKLHSNGYLIFSFHDKSIESWISILNSVDEAGFVLTKSYPLHSETRTGAHTSNKNSIALDMMLICKKKKAKCDNVFNHEKQQNLIKGAYEKTEYIVDRLVKINAEITIPDIENIFISEYFSLASYNDIEYKCLLKYGLDNIQTCVNNLQEYFAKYEISKRRSGWWSELYKKKWEM